MNGFLIAAVFVFIALVIVNYTATAFVIIPLIALFVCAIGAFLTHKTDQLVKRNDQ